MPLDLARIRAICFDIDGTLSDTDDKAVQKIIPFLSPLKWIAPRVQTEKIARRIVMGIETPGNWVYSIPDALGLDDELAWLGERLARFNHTPPSFLLVPGVQRMLKHLQPRFPLAVISARNRTGSEAFLHQFSLHEYFQQIITAQTCAHTKPYPDPLLHAADQFGLQPSELLMVGDTTVDIVAARKAGAQSIGVLCGFGEEQELRRAGADLILPNTADIIQLFQ